MDDDEGKARRNVVVASGLVSLAAWFKVPAGSLGEKLLGMTGVGTPPLEPYRFWIAALVVLVYLGLRYRFSTEGKIAINAIRDEWLAARDRLAKGIVARVLARYTWFGWNSPLFHNHLETLGKKLNREAQINQGQPAVTDAMRPHFSVIEVVFKSGTEGEATINPSWHFPSSPPRKQSGGSHGIQFTGTRRLWLHMLSSLRVTFYSTASVQYIVPIGLLAAAVGICLWKATTI